MIGLKILYVNIQVLRQERWSIDKGVYPENI